MEEKVLEILEEICGDEVVREDLDVDLVEEGLIDSLDYTEMLVKFEEELGIVIAPSEVTREEMATPRKIMETLKERM